MKILGSFAMQAELVHSLRWERKLVHTEYNNGVSQGVLALGSYWKGKCSADILSSLKVSTGMGKKRALKSSTRPSPSKVS